MELREQSTKVIVVVGLLSQLLPCRASDRIDNFVVQDSANICCIGIGRGKRQAPSESLLEAELYQWLLDCKIRISKPAKSLQKLTGKTSAKFFIEIDKQDKSARLELTQSSGSRHLISKHKMLFERLVRLRNHSMICLIDAGC